MVRKKKFSPNLEPNPTKNKYLAEMSRRNPDAMYPSGFESAVIGIVSNVSSNDIFLMSTKKIIQILQKKEKMTRQEAEEYFDYNIWNAHVGEHMPMYLDDLKEIPKA